MRRPAPLLAIAAALMPFPVLAQEAAPEERVRQIVIYGNDRCPTGEDGEVVVCARRPESERYRVPRNLRETPPDPQGKSWAERAKALDRASPDGLNNCSPVGPAGSTGCVAQAIRDAQDARAEGVPQ